MGKVERNKQQKRSSLLDTAFELFTTQGETKTSIADIVQRAGVAKGTFYLYFKDKHDIRNRLIAHKSAQLFSNAAAAMTMHGELCFIDKVLFLIDHIIDQLNADKSLLNFISKNLSWGVFKKALINMDNHENINFHEVYMDMLREADHTIREPEIMLFLIIELVSSTCYSAILSGEPTDIDSLKPYQFDTVRLIIRNHELPDS